MTVTAGVAAIKGTYAGSCALSDLEPHESLVMKLQGAGAPGHHRRDGRRRLRRRRRRHHDDHLRRRRGRRRHGRRRRPADAHLGLASGWPGSSSATSTSAIAGGPRGRRGPRRSRAPPAAAGAAGPPRPGQGSSPRPPTARRASRRRTTSSRASRRRRAGAARRRRRRVVRPRADERRATSTVDSTAREHGRAPYAAGEISARELLDLHLARIAERNPRAQRDRLPRRGAGPGRAPRPPTRRWPPGADVGPAARAAVRVQGHPRGGGLAHDVRLAAVRRPRARRRRADRRAGPRAPAWSSIGKTNVPEFAAGSHTFNTVFGTTLNPVDPTRSAGGSSGGAACALASGHGAARRRLRHGRLAAQPGVVLRRRRAAAVAGPGARVAARTTSGRPPRSAARWPATSATSRCCSR